MTHCPNIGAKSQRQQCHTNIMINFCYHFSGAEQTVKMVHGCPRQKSALVLHNIRIMSRQLLMEQKDQTLAANVELGSSKSSQILGRTRCQHVSCDVLNCSSSPNLTIISSSVGLSLSRSSRSRICSVSRVSRWRVYVIQQQGSTYVHRTNTATSSSLSCWDWSIDLSATLNAINYSRVMMSSVYYTHREHATPTYHRQLCS